MPDRRGGRFPRPAVLPGSDYIGLSNTYITDAVARDLDGEDVSQRLAAYEEQYFRQFGVSLSYYLNQYWLFGDAQVTCVKLLWDYGFYWSFPALWFYHDKWTDLEFQAQAAEEYRRATELNAQMQKLFARWHQLDGREWHNSFVTLFPWLAQISDELDDELDDETLLAKAKRDLAALEGFAVTVFEKASRSLDGVEVDRRTPVNPYSVSLEPERWEQDGLHSGAGIAPRDARKPVKGLQFAWLDEFGGDIGSATPAEQTI